MPASTVLIVDDEPDIRELVKEILEDEGYVVSTAENGESARTARLDARPDLILLDIWMPDIDGISLLREWAESGGLSCPVIMMSGHGNVETAVEATRLGAYDFIEKPIALAKLLLTVERALQTRELQKENEGLRRRLPATIEPVGISEKMQQLRAQIERVAEHDARVLLIGEPGAGKETIARYTHESGPRSQHPFVEVKVSALDADRGGADLFGLEDGPTVAPGRLEDAADGTIFFDEIANMDLGLQQRLAGALEGNVFTRTGGCQEIELRARVIASSRYDLKEKVSAGEFHEALYFQLNVVPLTVPPLRDRPEDVPELLKFFTDYFPSRDSLPYRRFSMAAQNRLRNYAWPGNVRELKNLVQRLLILGRDEEIGLEEVEQAIGSGDSRELVSEIAGDIGFDLPLREAREQFERRYFVYQLQRTQGSVGKLAGIVGMERTHLYRKLRALGVDPKKASGK